MNPFLYLILPSFIIGISVCWIYHAVKSYKQNRIIKSLEGLLESERLVKETLRRENALAFQLKENVEFDLNAKLKIAEKKIKSQDEDIILLQKSNEMTEAEFKAAQPEIYDLKIKLIAAQNTISRLKAELRNCSVAV